MPVDLNSPADVLAATLWGEARGCGASGMRHVASVILNRAAHPTWWGNDVQSVCLAPFQFSCWNEGDPNRDKMLAVTESSDPWFGIAISIANAAMRGKMVDETHGADSYYAITMPHPPGWTARATHTYSDGWHSFWNVRTPAQSGDPEAPNVSLSATDRLNSEELAKIS